MKIYNLPFIVLLFAGNIESSDELLILSCKFKEIETEFPETYDVPQYKNSKSLVINTTKNVVEYLDDYNEPRPFEERGNEIFWQDKLTITPGEKSQTDYWNNNLDRITGEYVLRHSTIFEGRSFATIWFTHKFECKKVDKLF